MPVVRITGQQFAIANLVPTVHRTPTNIGFQADPNMHTDFFIYAGEFPPEIAVSGQVNKGLGRIILTIVGKFMAFILPTNGLVDASTEYNTGRRSFSSQNRRAHGQ